ncbi:putative peptidyl-tRNA hydrolase PTRHD1 isoform X2 [Alligator mississippiensis]|uniref:putative peptidyl-tRNA hydrolase PTRHD1 isoform X2 n=1 Tax=Alligator mississippiensis TaxID=8496 RepID=UPI0009076428|nr:putative peptidyl-tRNA hydrolase PTRHD1 isoform X2 [Alligator mississippiensis]
MHPSSEIFIKLPSTLTQQQTSRSTLSQGKQGSRSSHHPAAAQAPDEGALMTLAETLKEHSVDHEMWIEQPENIATCIALRPYPKDQVHQYLKKFKLLK